LDLSLEMLFTVLALFVGLAGLIWKMVDSLIQRQESAKKRIIESEKQSKKEALDRELDANKRLEEEKAQIQKELEKQKQRHVDQLIQGIREEISKLDKKLSRVHESYIELNTKFESNEDKYNQVLTEVHEFFKTTKARFDMLEKQASNHEASIEDIKTRLMDIGNDLVIVKDAADKVRSSKG